MQNNISPDITKLLDNIKADYPALNFEETNRFSWHAGTRLVTYKPLVQTDIHGIWALLHEIGHALLKHTDFKTDIELLKIEVMAWEKAKKLAHSYSLKIDEDYIQSCLDSYRDWLHLRSTCPNCYERSLQSDRHTYRCINCHTEWHVTRSRLCRPYRKLGQHL